MRASVTSDAGTGPTTVVYVPGIDGTGELLLGTAERIERQYRLVRLRYASEPPFAPGVERYAQLGRTIVERLNELGIERAVLLAESFGVSLALRTALDHPGRIRALLLVNGFAYYPWRVRLSVSTLVARVFPPGLYRFGRHNGAAVGLFGPRRDAAIEAEFFALEGSSFDASFAERLSMIAGVDLRTELGSLHCPVTLCASTRDRIVPSESAARTMLAALPNAELERLEGSGHVVLPFPDEPWIERIERLLARAPG